MQLRNITKEEFIARITAVKEDRFAKTFVSKANLQNLWQDCIGAFDGAVLMGAIITTVGKREPKVANLQLLHTFADSRKKGAGRALCDFSLFMAKQLGAEYFRVSAEPEAVDFYKTLGFCFLGKQKSGCSLSMFKINGEKFVQGLYNINDPIIRAAVYKKGKGGCVEVMGEKRYDI